MHEESCFNSSLNCCAVHAVFHVRLRTGARPENADKKELIALLKTAKEPPEHLRIAAYYHREAERLTADAKFHQEMGTIYKKSPWPFEAKHPYGTIGVSHCDYWSRLDAKQAGEALALAELHEDMAKAAEKK